jgi:hypothetical protein
LATIKLAAERVDATGSENHPFQTRKIEFAGWGFHCDILHYGRRRNRLRASAVANCARP